MKQIPLLRLAAGFAGIAVFAALVLIAVPLRAAGPLDAVVGVRAIIPADARTAPFLGTSREGSGVVIGEDGLVLTIGYLILEAIEAEIMLPGDRAVPADVVAYDYNSGFGLLRAAGRLGVSPIEFGKSGGLQVDDEVLVAGFGGPEPVIGAHVVLRREFAGYWEYLLPDAIFTAPPHLGFGGAALIGRDGRLLGVGSLIVADAAGPDEQVPGNMFVPIDALPPILDDLLASGRSGAPPHPWLGVYSEDVRGRVFVTRVASYGPAAKAGLDANDIIVEVAGQPVTGMADFYRKVWALGPAGVEVPLTVLKPDGVTNITVISADRYNYLKLKPSY